MSRRAIEGARREVRAAELVLKGKAARSRASESTAAEKSGQWAIPDFACCVKSSMNVQPGALRLRQIMPAKTVCFSRSPSWRRPQMGSRAALQSSFTKGHPAHTAVRLLSLEGRCRCGYAGGPNAVYNRNWTVSPLYIRLESRSGKKRRPGKAKTAVPAGELCLAQFVMPACVVAAAARALGSTASVCSAALRPSPDCR